MMYLDSGGIMNNTTYANGYRCTLDRDGKEMVLNFIVTVPVVDENGKQEVKTTTVANVIMSRQNVEKLKDSLAEILNQFDSDKPIRK